MLKYSVATHIYYHLKRVYDYKAIYQSRIWLLQYCIVQGFDKKKGTEKN